MKADKNWILDAGQQDLFRLRNRIATELWNDFARKPYYVTDGAEFVTGVRGRVVEVFLNDEYVGIYSLTETMDNKTLGLKKSKKGIIHGQLWKTSGRGLSMMYNTPSALITLLQSGMSLRQSILILRMLILPTIHPYGRLLTL